MKIRQNLHSILLLSVAAFALIATTTLGADIGSTQYEYITIRWGGRDNTHIIRPGGVVDFVGPELRAIQKPNKADERSFYMNLTMNHMARQGYEVVAFITDEIVMKRKVPQTQ